MAVNLNLKDFDYNKHGTSHWRPLRLLITLVALGAIAYGIGRATSLRWSQVEAFFKGRIAAWKMLTIVGSLSVTALALACIFHKATRGKDSAYDKLKAIHGQAPGRGKFWGDKHWVPIKLETKTYVAADYILDTSTLKDGTGACFAYNHKPCSMSELIAAESGLLGAPLYIPAVAIYNLLAWPVAAYKNKSNPLCELGKSCWRVVQSPFYGLAYFIAQLYVFIDPPNGRKLVAGVERDWNRGALVENSCWIANGSHKYDAHEETGMDLGREGHSGFYIEGCFQPVAVLQFKDHILQTAKPTNGYNEAVSVKRGWKDV